MNKPVYKFPCGKEVDADLYPKHYCNKLPMMIALISGVKDTPPKYFSGHTEESINELEALYPDAVHKQTIYQRDTSGLVESFIYYYIGTLTESVFPVKEFEYTSPACNTSSNYKVNVTISSEEYSRTFCVNINTRNFTSFAALETAVDTLHEELKEFKHGAVKCEGEEEECVYSVEMYDKHGLSYMHNFDNNPYEPPFKELITSLVIADFEMIIDGDQNKAGENNDRS